MDVMPAQEFAKTYGPFAFGIASLLILWYTIMRPELDSKRLDFESHRKLIEEQSAQVKVLQINSQLSNDTAKILEQTVLRLEKINAIPK